MPSKGLQLYTYINLEGIEVEYKVPDRQILRSHPTQFSNDHLEVDKKHLSALSVSGRFSLTVRRHGQELTTQWCDINTLTGSPTGGTLKGLAQQTSIIHDDAIVCYGFYDAGSGTAGLPNTHQVYVTVTPNHARWMSVIVAPGSPQADRALRSFVLPAAHDIGMNTMRSSDELVHHAGGAYIETLNRNLQPFATVASAVATPIASGIAPEIIYGLSVTQKDSVADILRIGARYFEFRPSHVFDKVRGALPDKLYFMHGPIPGLPYDEFLHDVVDFLKQQPTELVVVQLRWDGVPAECARPSEEELQHALDEALRGSDLQVANLDDMRNQSVKELREQRKRLVMLRDCRCYSTYDDLANATLDGESMLARFAVLDHEQQKCNDLTNLQCQATATNIKDVVIHAVLKSDASNSCLLATKAICDHRLLPWVRDHALEKLTDDGLILLMNDFFDGATADVAIDLTRKRLG